MYMRYAGGGVGHYKVDLKEGSRDSAPPPEPELEPAEDAFNTSDTAGNHCVANFQTVDDAVTNLLSTADNAASGGHDFAEDDSGEDSDCEDLDSEPEGCEDYDEENIEVNFGAEDGEDMFRDVEDEEGYAPL